MKNSRKWVGDWVIFSPLEFKSTMKGLAFTKPYFVLKKKKKNSLLSGIWKDLYLIRHEARGFGGDTCGVSHRSESRKSLPATQRSLRRPLQRGCDLGVARSRLRGEEGVFHYQAGSPWERRFGNVPSPGPHVVERPSVVRFSVLASCHSTALKINHCPTAWSVDNNNRVSQPSPSLAETK